MRDTPLTPECSQNPNAIFWVVTLEFEHQGEKFFYDLTHPNMGYLIQYTNEKAASAGRVMVEQDRPYQKAVMPDATFVRAYVVKVTRTVVP